MKKVITSIALLWASSMFAQCWDTIAVGGYHSLAISTTGKLYTWGYNDKNQLGQVPVNPKTPTELVLPGRQISVKEVSAASKFSACLAGNGTLYVWGENTLGQLGLGDNLDRATPTAVPSNLAWVHVSCGGGAIYGIKSDGTLWASGDNSAGNLGDGTKNSRNTFAQVGNLNTWKEIWAGYGVFFGVAGNTLYGCGRNNRGVLGINSTTERLVLTTVTTRPKLFATASSFGMLVQNNGGLYTWGGDNFGVLGNGSQLTSDVLFPTQINSGSTYTAISAGAANAYAVKSDGTLWSWGWSTGTGINGSGNLDAPRQVGTATNWKMVAANGIDNIGAAITVSGKLYMWGNNTQGQLGSSSPITAFTPIQVGTCVVSGVEDENELQEEIMIYPNPSAGSFQIQVLKASNILVLNQLGEEILEKEVNALETLEVNELENGIYFVRISVNGATQVKKIVVQK